MVRKTYNDNFEDVYLKWRSLEDSKPVKPERFKEFNYSIICVSNRLYHKHIHTFKNAGFELDDILNISRCYLVAYLNLYSIQDNDKYRKKFIDNYIEKNSKNPSAEDFRKKDNSNFISFLSQRLSNCATVCTNKNRNITADKQIVKQFLKLDNAVELSNSDMLISKYNKKIHQELGYQQLTQKEWNELRKSDKIAKYSNGVNPTEVSIGEVGDVKVTTLPAIKDNVQYIDGKIIHSVNIPPKPLEPDDYVSNVLENSTGIDLRNPEDIAIMNESVYDIDDMREKFENLPIRERFKTLIEFINTYKDNIYYRDEISTARKMLINIRKSM